MSSTQTWDEYRTHKSIDLGAPQLAQALRAAGHEVLVATAGDAVAGDIGLPVEDIAPRFNFGRIAARMMLGHPS